MACDESCFDAELHLQGRAAPEFHPVSSCRPGQAEAAWRLVRPRGAGDFTAGRLQAMCQGLPAPLAAFEPREPLQPPQLRVQWMGATGWGAVAAEALLPGGFVCFYAGELLADAEAEARCTAPGRDAYLFNLTTAKQCRKLGAEVVSTGDEDNPVYVIDAYVKGNVGRFLNHACGPSFEANVSPIYLFGPEDVVDARLPRVAFFANRSIAPGEELRYDYGMPPEAVLSPSGGVRHQSCLCESRACRGRIY
ncbi:unnamed protein product [Effrenium voratum]|uniref:SET domain-containing protein n=1 Tax=Effrenium voratum TaxID=2562239 RepID=A0AA36N276_9DINO|nr:unnamed protein product [Effrenium voratum]CAJ1424463.1 unnamed protein product [Effrenium voratum]